MAPIFKPLVFASALFAAISSAAPVDLNKRDKVVVWETVTTVVWTTVDVTTTIYPTGTPQAPTPTPAVAEPTTTPAPALEQPKPIEASEQPQPQVPETQSAPAAPAAQPTQPAAAAVAAPAPKEPTSQPAPQSSPQPAAPTANSGSSSGYTGSCSKESPCVGQLTYYDTATSASAPSSCGMTNDGFTENVVALPVGIMTDADCGKTVTMTYNGVTATGIVVDKCMGCDPTSADVSRHFFGDLADLGAGRLHGVSWYIN